jgi:hypothetical protein
VIVLTPDGLDFSESYLEDDASARWRSASGHQPSMGASASGSSVIEVPADCRLPRHRNAGDEMLRFAAVYASPHVVTRYEQEVQPDGSRERRTVA